MSNYISTAIHPATGETCRVEMLDDYYGPHRYAVRFPDGSVYPESKVKLDPYNLKSMKSLYGKATNQEE